jgi:hypothetical protein
MSLPSALDDYVKLLQVEVHDADVLTKQKAAKTVRDCLTNIELLVRRDAGIILALREFDRAWSLLVNTASRSRHGSDTPDIESLRNLASAALHRLEEALQRAMPSARAEGLGLGW